MSDAGCRGGAPGILLVVAMAQHAAGRAADAESTVDMALAIAEQTGQSAWSADLYRVAGELCLTSGNATGAIEALGRAIATAREQGARVFELRAATNLALLRDQGRAHDARGLLAPIHGWFTEGFDTADVIEARALLDELR